MFGKNFEIFRDFLSEHGMAKLAHQFLLASGKLTGRPTHAGTFRAPLKLTDADGSSATVVVTLVVKPRPHAAR